MPRFQFSLRPPRHPVPRMLLALAGLSLLVFFAAFALAIGVLVLAAFGLRRLLASSRAALRPQAPSQPGSMDGVIDAEFSVVRKPHTLLPR
jgi:hypothetical protein